LFKIIKKLLKFFSIVATLLLGLHIILIQWNFNFLFPQIQNYFSKNYSINFKLDGDIKIKILPFPKVSITDIKYSDDDGITEIIIPKVQVKINLLKIFNKEELLDLYNTSLYNAKIKVLDLENQGYYEMLQKFLLKSNTDSTKIFLRNAELEFIDKDSALVKRKIEKLNLTFRNANNYHLDLNSTFSENQEQYSLFIESKDLDKDLNPDNIVISLQHNLLHFYTILSRQAKSDKLIGTANIHFHNKLGGNFSDLKEFTNKQNFKKIKADIEFNKECLRVNNFITDFEGINNIKGEANYHRKSKILDLNLSIEELNLDQLFLKYYGKDDKNSKIEFNSMDLLDFLTKRREFGFSTFITSSTNIDINKIILNDKSINNFKLEFSSWPSITTKNQKILVNNLSMLFPGNSKFITHGIISNSTIPIFRGHLLFTSESPKDLIEWKDNSKISEQINNSPILLKSDVVLMPYILQLYHTQIASKNTQLISNILALNYPGRNKLQLYTKISADSLNLDDFNFDDKFDDVMYTLYKSDFDNSGEKFAQNTNNLNFLRTQKGFKNLTLEVDKLIFKKQLFYNTHVNLDISKDRLKVDHVNIKHKYGRYSGHFILSLPGIKPLIEADFNFTELHDKFLYLLFPSQEKFSKRYKRELLKVGKNKGKISDINFYSLRNFDGNFRFNINKFFFKDFEFDNFALAGDIKNQEINFDNIRAEAFNGEVKANGNISTLRPIYSMQLGLGLGNINPSLLLNKLINYDNNSGYMSASGVFLSKGINLEEIKQNLTGSINVEGKNIQYNGLGLVELADIPRLQTNLDYKLKRLNYYSQYGETQFDNISGTINIKNSIAKMINLKLTNERLTGLLNLVYSFSDNSLNANSKFSFIPVRNSNPITIDITNSGTLVNTKTAVDVSALEDYLRKNSH
jgi:hypothetical protein